MKRLITLAVAVMAIGTASAQQDKGGITAEMMQQIRLGQTNSAAERAARNAMASNPIAELATNADNLAMIDTNFSHRVKTKGITDQHQSGRCWIFTGLNVLRAKMIDEQNLAEMEFSQNYIFFYDQLEKCNLFLQAVIDTKSLPMEDRQVEWLFKNPLNDGGQFTGVSNLVMKYGVVPSEVMPENYQSNNTGQVGNLLSLKLRALKTEMLTEIYSMLVRAYGVPPTEFEWTRRDKDGNVVDTKTYTPQSFYAEYFGDLDAYMSEDAVRENPIRDLLYKWADEGWLHIVPGKTFDPAVAVNRIVELDAKNVNFFGFGYDPYNTKTVINALTQWIVDIGLDPKTLIRPVRQNFATYSPAVKEFDYMVRRGIQGIDGKVTPNPMIHLSQNPLWPWEFGNVSLHESSDGMENLKPVKANASASCKVDNIQMLLSALILHDAADGDIKPD